MSGLVPIKVFKQSDRMLREFTSKLENSLKSEYVSISLDRAFGVLIYYCTVFSLSLGMILGVLRLSEDNGSMFGVQILILIRLTLSIQYMLREFIQLQSTSLSLGRALAITKLSTEKDFTTEYDFDCGLIN